MRKEEDRTASVLETRCISNVSTGNDADGVGVNTCELELVLNDKQFSRLLQINRVTILWLTFSDRIKGSSARSQYCHDEANYTPRYPIQRLGTRKRGHIYFY